MSTQLLQNLQILEVSACDDPANLTPGFMVMKSKGVTIESEIKAFHKLLLDIRDKAESPEQMEAAFKLAIAECPRAISEPAIEGLAIAHGIRKEYGIPEGGERHSTRHPATGRFTRKPEEEKPAEKSGGFLSWRHFGAPILGR